MSRWDAICMRVTGQTVEVVRRPSGNRRRRVESPATRRERGQRLRSRALQSSAAKRRPKRSSAANVWPKRSVVSPSVRGDALVRGLSQPRRRRDPSTDDPRPSRAGAATRPRTIQVPAAASRAGPAPGRSRPRQRLELVPHRRRRAAAAVDARGAGRRAAVHRGAVAGRAGTPRARRPSEIEARWSWRCYGLRDDDASMLTLQKVSKTLLVSPSSAPPAGASRSTATPRRSATTSPKPRRRARRRRGR